MIREVLQAGLNTPIIFANDKDEPVGSADFASQLFEHVGRLAAKLDYACREKQHWRRAEKALKDKARTMAAETRASGAFRAALLAEGWLQE
jgi:hypothetical protein